MNLDAWVVHPSITEQRLSSVAERGIQNTEDIKRVHNIATMNTESIVALREEIAELKSMITDIHRLAKESNEHFEALMAIAKDDVTGGTTIH